MIDYRPRPKLAFMPSVLRGARWWVAHLLVITLAVLFVNLGFWQLRRLEERRLQNTVWQTRMADVPLPIGELLAGAGSDLDSLEYRPAIARGTYAPEREVLVRSQVMEGTAGFHVITPLVLQDGSAVLVNRGWVPLEMDSVPVPAMPPVGEVEVTGWIRPSQPRQGMGPIEPSTGTLTQVARVDIDRLQQQMSWPLAPVYLVADNNAGALPAEVAAPDLTDQGPHLGYAIQWFAFALIGVVGYLFLLRRAVSRSIQGETIDDNG